VALTVVEAEVITVLLLVFVVFLVGLYLLRRRLAARRRELQGEIAESEARTEERAHNQILLGEAELATLTREGFDVARPKGLLDDARSAFARRDYHHALQIARSVHDQLVRLRVSGAGPSPTLANPPIRTLFGAGPPADLAPAVEAPLASTSEDAPRAALPKNQLESRFQIRLLTEELVVAVRSRPGAPELSEANRLAREASASADRADYTEALRLSLKARRLLGGKVEGLPAPAGSFPAAAAAGSGSDPATEGPVPPRPPSDGRSGGECPRCHRPLRVGDVFCRSCGTPVTAPKCPRCGAAFEADDRFCPRCGAPTA
jgi:hypothetical protein